MKAVFSKEKLMCTEKLQILLTSDYEEREIKSRHG